MPIGEGQPRYESELGFENATEDDIKPLIYEIDRLVPPGNSDLFDMTPLAPGEGLVALLVNKHTFDHNLTVRVLLIERLRPDIGEGVTEIESWKIDKKGNDLKLDRLKKFALPNENDPRDNSGPDDFVQKSFALQSAMGLTTVSRQECRNMVRKLTLTHPHY